MKTRACPINLASISLDELNKALAFYYGKSAYLTDADGGTLHYHTDIDDSIISKLLDLGKLAFPSGKVIDTVIPETNQACCQTHHVSAFDMELDNGTLLLDRLAIECLHLLRLIYIRLADDYFSTHHISVPNLIDIHHLQTAGYFEKFPAQAMVAGTLPLDPFQVTHFLGMHQGNPSDALEFFSEKKYAANPVTCYHVYSNFSKLYDRFHAYRFTVEGKAHRYEGKNSQKGRLIEFNMSEIVFMEHETNVIPVEEIIRFYKEFFVLFNLPVVFKTGSDAFFTIDAKLHAQMQERSASKIELICRFADTDFAVGSINTHHDYFVKRFNLESRYGVLSTKCTGIGMERLFMALRSVHSDKLKELLIHVYSRLDQDYPPNGRASGFGKAM